MVIERFRYRIVVALFAWLPLAAWGEATGTLIVAGKTTTLQEAYAARLPSVAGSPAQWLLVVSDQRVDDGWTTAGDQPKALHAALKRARARYFEVLLQPAGRGAETMNLVWPGLIELKGTGSPEDFRLTRFAPGIIEGDYHSLPEPPATIGPGTEYIAFRFSVALPAGAQP